MKTYPTVVGIDPSLTSTGIALAATFDGSAASFATSRFRTKAPKGATWDDRAERISKLSTAIIGSVPMGSLVVIEAPAYSSSTGSMWDRAGLWWTLGIGLREKSCTLLEVTPNQRAKYATGSGGGANSGKDMVLAATIKRYPSLDITGNDVADAVLLMAIGLRMIGHPIEDSLPKACLAALDKLVL